MCGSDVGYFILGDSAYPLQKWLLKPYPDTGRLTEGQELYNVRTSRACCVVEHAFGMLKGQWKCLSKNKGLQCKCCCWYGGGILYTKQPV